MCAKYTHTQAHGPSYLICTTHLNTYKPTVDLKKRIYFFNKSKWKATKKKDGKEPKKNSSNFKIKEKKKQDLRSVFSFSLKFDLRVALLETLTKQQAA